MNQECKWQVTYKWRSVATAETLTTKRLKTTSVVFILASDQRDAKVINPTFISTGTEILKRIMTWVIILAYAKSVLISITQKVR